MKLILKGFLIGIGKIMPGVSGAMIAMSLNEYNKIIESIANIKKDIYNNTKYLSKIGIGIILAIILASKIIVNCLNTRYFATMLLFIFIILNGTTNIIKQTKSNKKDIVISIFIIILVILLKQILKIQFINTNTKGVFEFIKIIGIGIIDALSSIVPGISGTALLMYFGYYEKILNTFATITNKNIMTQNILTIIPFIIGFIFGTIIISKIINKIIKKYPNTLNTTVVMFMIYSLIILTQNTIREISQINEILFGIMLFIITLILSLKISNKK